MVSSGSLPLNRSDTLTRPTPKPAVVRLSYKIIEAAEALSTSTVTLHRAISHELIKSTKVGRVIRIPAAEVERVAVEGLPPIPRTYKRKTLGPTTRGAAAQGREARQAQAHQGIPPPQDRRGRTGDTAPGAAASASRGPRACSRA